MHQGDGQMLACVLSEGHTASTDYFILPKLRRDGYLVELVDTRIAPVRDDIPQSPTLVIISRYLPARWRSVVASLGSQGVKLVYFMDDDLLDRRAWGGLPWRYRWKLTRNALKHQGALRELGAELWVSTRYLAEKYAGLSPIMIAPVPIVKPQNTSPLVRICYHGTASHPDEISWLRDVMAEVQGLSENCHFELFGSAAVKKLYRGIPRVSVLHAMTWSDYLTWSSSVSRDIALAPLLNTGFNAARGATKFFDYTRMQAAGIYSNVAPYAGYINDGVDGILLDNDTNRWVDMILELANSPDKRHSIIAAATNRIDVLAKD